MREDTNLNCAFTFKALYISVQINAIMYSYNSSTSTKYTLQFLMLNSMPQWLKQDKHFKYFVYTHIHCMLPYNNSRPHVFLLTRFLNILPLLCYIFLWPKHHFCHSISFEFYLCFFSLHPSKLRYSTHY